MATEPTPRMIPTLDPGTMIVVTGIPTPEGSAPTIRVEIRGAAGEVAVTLNRSQVSDLSEALRAELLELGFYLT